MTSRRRSSTTISLFAFQDIITSVTGVVILIVLILTLELAERPDAAAAPSPVDARQLQRSIDGAEREIQRFKRSLGDSESLIRELAKTNPTALELDIAQSKHKLEALAAEIGELKLQASQIDTSETGLAQTRSAITDGMQELGKLEAQNAELQRQLKTERQEDRPIYRLPRGFNRHGWLIVIGADSVAAAPLDRAAVPTFFQSSSFLGTADAKFLTWSAQQDRETYFLLLVRPRGQKLFDKIQDALDRRGTAFGFDVIDENKKILDPEKGAQP